MGMWWKCPLFPDGDFGICLQHWVLAHVVWQHQDISMLHQYFRFQRAYRWWGVAWQWCPLDSSPFRSGFSHKLFIHTGDPVLFFTLKPQRCAVHGAESEQSNSALISLLWECSNFWPHRLIPRRNELSRCDGDSLWSWEREGGGWQGRCEGNWQACRQMRGHLTNCSLATSGCAFG